MSTYLVSDRQTALDVGYEIVKDEEIMKNVTYEKYVENLSSWNLKAIQRDDEVIGVVCTKDKMLHLAVVKKWQGRWMTRGILRNIFDTEGTIVTGIRLDAKTKDYLFRLGFKETDNNNLILEKTPCLGY
jgi:hypothetical protein